MVRNRELLTAREKWGCLVLVVVVLTVLVVLFILVGVGDMITDIDKPPRP